MLSHFRDMDIFHFRLCSEMEGPFFFLFDFCLVNPFQSQFPFFFRGLLSHYKCFLSPSLSLSVRLSPLALVFLNKISADLLEISGFCVWLQEHGEMFGH